MYLKEFSTGKIFLMIFGFITIKLLHTLNIKIKISINSATIPQTYIFHLLCDMFSLTSVTFLRFCYMIFFSLNNYLPVFY